MKEVAQRRLEKRINVVLMDSQHPFPLENESVDIVTCRAAFHHFQDVDAVLEEVARVLRLGDRFFSWTPISLHQPATSG
jgi:ubiquinone/menaquinone biosynthesis C-methylase UbiE